MFNDNDEHFNMLGIRPQMPTLAFEAESVSFSVNSFFGIDTGANSFGYILEWSRGRELKELNASLDTIRKTTAELIDAIDGKFQEIVKERNISFVIGEQQAELAELSQEAATQPVPTPETAEPVNRQRAGAVYAIYCNKTADAVKLDETYTAILNADEQNARTECDAAVNRVVMGLLSDLPSEHTELYRQYTENPDFKERLEDYVFIKTYLEPQTEQRNAAKEPTAHNVVDVSAIIEAYARNAEASDPQRIGSVILMTPLFDDGNLNRNGKKIRVTVEESAGKYQLFSRDEGGDKMYYFLTASGRIDNTAGYFRSEWDEKQHKRVYPKPTETELDELLPMIAEQFENDMANPTKWALFQHAAALNRLDECEAHNAPVRELREQEQKRRHEEAEKERQEEKVQKQEKYDNRVDEIAKAIENSAVISVAYNEYEFDGKNPVLDLFKMYDIALPLRTQGWVNTGLAEITESGYRYYSSKHKGDSIAFGECLYKLREAIKEMSIEQKRGMTVTNTEVKNTVETKLYEKFAEMFPQFMNGDYSTLRLEAEHAKPLELEWVFGDRLSIAHTYELDGKPAYEPMIMFTVNSRDKTMTACSFELSEPPRNDVVYDDKGHADVAMQQNINNLAVGWLDRAEKQGFKAVSATVELDENGNISKEGLITDKTVQITFDEDGNPILPKPEKEYDLGYGHLGNGLTVWNRLEEKNGDYVTVAHIDPDRSVKFYDKDMPEIIKEQIEHIARTSDARTSVSQPEKHVFRTPPETELQQKDVEEKYSDELDLSMPDPTIGFSEMNLYGYAGDDMFPLTNSRAVELFDTDHCIYLLYPDNTEAMALDRDEILNHDGLCGIESVDWERSPVRAAQLAIAANSEGIRESELLYANDNRFGIYQIRDGIDEARNFRFAPMRELEALGLTADRANYELVYTAPFSERIEFLSDRYPVLNKIYEDFNANHPADFTGHSLSVSDVVVLKYNGDLSTHFVDSVGFAEIDNYAFFGEEIQNASVPQTLSQVGTRSEEYNGKSAAELESDAKSGKVISLTDFSKALNAERNNDKRQNDVPKNKKPTLMERLEANKQKAARQGQQETPENNERRDRE